MNERSAETMIEGRRVAVGMQMPGEFTYCVVESHRKSGAERRIDRRVRTRLHEGVIAGSAASGLVDCRILNQSRSGLRLQLGRACALPRNFRLTDAAASIAYEVRLMWQNGLTAGVQVISRRNERGAKPSR